MPPLLNDGLLVVLQKSGGVLPVVACMLWGSFVVVALIHRLTRGELAASEYLSIAAAGWLAPVLLIAIPLFIAGAALAMRAGLIFTAALMAALLGGALLLMRAGGSHRTAAGLAGFLGLLALFIVGGLARLAFVARTALPLYFDSAEHYRIVRVLAEAFTGGSAGGLTWPTTTYYHYGFHLIMAMMTAISGQAPATLILVSGQLILAALPLCLLLIVQRETSSVGAGWMAVVVAGVGWYMPAFSVNWGKYPAVFSLPVVFLCLGAAYLASKRAGTRRVILAVVALAAAFVAFLLHTRSIILILFALVAWWLAGRASSGSGRVRGLFLALVVLSGLAIVGVLIVTPTLAPVFDPYIGSGLTVTVLAGLLAIPGLATYPRLALASLVFGILSLLALFAPVPGFGLSPLLDRPLVEMILFAPLSVLAACGVAALAQTFAAVPTAVRAAGLVALGVALSAHALVNYSWYPSDCCQLVQADDLVALDWIGQNLPPQSVIAISQAELRDAPSPYQAVLAGTDAGTWIPALSGRSTLGIPRSTDFGDAGTVARLCKAQVGAIYVGSHGFDVSALDSEPGWYVLELQLPGARVYRMAGCG